MCKMRLIYACIPLQSNDERIMPTPSNRIRLLILAPIGFFYASTFLYLSSLHLVLPWQIAVYILSGFYGTSLCFVFLQQLGIDAFTLFQVNRIFKRVDSPRNPNAPLFVYSGMFLLIAIGCHVFIHDPIYSGTVCLSLILLSISLPLRRLFLRERLEVAKYALIDPGRSIHLLDHWNAVFSGASRRLFYLVTFFSLISSHPTRPSSFMHSSPSLNLHFGPR